MDPRDVLQVWNKHKVLLGISLAKKCLSLFWQEKGVSIELHKEDFEAYIATIESYCGFIGYEEGQIQDELKRSVVDENNLMDK